MESLDLGSDKTLRCAPKRKAANKSLIEIITARFHVLAQVNNGAPLTDGNSVTPAQVTNANIAAHVSGTGGGSLHAYTREGVAPSDNMPPTTLIFCHLNCYFSL